MQNSGDWKRSKFERTSDGSWRANRKEVPASSRLFADLIASSYADAISKHARGRLVDLGCGRVPLYEMYRDNVSEVICIDWPGSLHNSPHIDFRADLNKPLEMEPGSFNTAIATDVLEHLYAPATFFTSVSRILKPGGTLILGVPFLYWIHEQPHDFHRYTRYALQRLAIDAGLQVVSLAPFGGGPHVVLDMAAKIVSGYRPLASFVYAFAQLLLWMPLAQNAAAATRELMPSGYVLVAQKP